MEVIMYSLLYISTLIDVGIKILYKSVSFNRRSFAGKFL